MSRLFLSALAAACVAFSVTSAAAFGAQATSIGERYDDGLDSRLAARYLADAARDVGYASSAHLSGRSAADAWDDGLRAAVFGVFGHANAGLAHLDEGAGGAKDQFLVAGFLGDTGPEHVAFWSDYLPFIDVDWMKLAVFAGCYTANYSEYQGSWPDKAREHASWASTASSASLTLSFTRRVAATATTPATTSGGASPLTLVSEIPSGVPFRRPSLI